MGACGGCAGCWPLSGGCGGCARWQQAPSAHWALFPVDPAGCCGMCGPTRCRCLLTSSLPPSGPSPSSGHCRYGWSHCSGYLQGTGRPRVGDAQSWQKRLGALLCPHHRCLCLTFTVLTAGAAPTIAVPQFWEAWVWVVGVWGWRVLVRESHGPRGGPWVWQRGQRVLVRGTTGTVVIMEGQVGHVCGGEEKAR